MVRVDLQERERVIEDMRLALTEQEETQTQLDLELENREAQINELTEGKRLERSNYFISLRRFTLFQTYLSKTTVTISLLYIRHCQICSFYTKV